MKFMSDTNPPTTETPTRMDRPSASPGPDRCLAIFGWALIVLFATHAAWQGRIGADVGAFQLAYVLGFAGYLALIRVVRRGASSRKIGSWRWWFVGCVAVRLILLGTTPSDDIYRYVWEGRAQLAGANPYVTAPNDPQLAPLRDDDWTTINHPDYPAIYGPVAEMQFRALAAIDPAPALFKWAHVLADVFVILVLSATLRRLGRPPHTAIIYGLCPLVLTAFAIEGHIDSVMLLFVACATWAQVARRPLFSAAMLGLAVATKLIAIVWIPWFLLRSPAKSVSGSHPDSPDPPTTTNTDWGSTIVFTVVLSLCYLPYLSAGTKLLSSFLRFSATGEFFSLPGTLHLTAYDTIMARGTVALLLVILVGVQARRSPTFPAFGLIATGVLLMLMPVVHYWYLAWVLVWAPLCLRWRWIVASLGMVLYFEAHRVQETTGAWAMPAYVPVAFWSAFLLTWVGEAVILSGKRRPLTAKSSP
jgi:hypothetical protein